MTLTRSEFESLLKYNFYSQLGATYTTIIALLTNDKDAMDAVLTQYVRANGKIAGYLEEYDAAPTDVQKDQVINNVVYDIGNATVDPESAVMWPNSGGRFGNIKAPLVATPGNLAGFNASNGQVAMDMGAPPAARSQASVNQTLNTPFRVSASRDSWVNYSVDTSCTLTLTGGQTATCFLEICADNLFASGVQEICRAVNSNSGTLTIGLNLVQTQTARLTGYVPAGYYARIRTANTVGSPQFNYRCGQEVLL